VGPSGAIHGFEAAASLYERSRPEYPAEAVDLLARLLPLRAGSTLLDLGAGTGKLSRLAAARGATVIGLEPAAAMVRQLGGEGVHAVRGLAEALPVRRHAVDAICAASAFHWFDGRRALAEAHRALRRGGRLALVWNVRDEAVPWVAALSGIVNRHEGAAPRYRSGAWHAAFDASRDMFRPLEEARFPNPHALSPDGVVDRVASVSFVAAMPEAERAVVLDEVRALLASNPGTAGRDELVLPYHTDVFVWERVG
jgi:SAM-dependent methyltransferase